MAEKNWPLWEVFIRSRTGLAHRHVGSVHAVDADDGARECARRLHTARRGPFHLGCAVGRHHRVGPGRQGHDVRADGLEDLSAPDVLRRAGRRGAHVTEAPLFAYTLRLADNALILGHRLSEWTGHAPVLEEELALANMALDLIGQARSLYSHAGEVEGRGRNEDALAYLRDAREFRNVLLVEQPNGDFAMTMVRQLLYAAFAHPYCRGARAFEGCNARRHRRQEREGDGLPRAPRRRMDDPARRRHGREPASRAATRSRSCGPMSASCSRSTRSNAR